MTLQSTPIHDRPVPAQVQAAFLLILPRIELHGRVAFRHVRCPHRRADALADMIALCWLWFLRLATQGKDPTRFAGALATFAARHVRAGRGLCGQEPGKDVLTPLAQQRRGFTVSPLPQASTQSNNPLEEALHDNTRTPPDEQAAFRMDFPAWLSSRSERDRRLIEDLLMGERTLDVAHKHGLSPSRISQLRREYMEDWGRFGEPTDRQPSPTRA